MTLWVLLTLAGSGLVIGFLSGLVGIGGGVLIVPLLYFFYGHAGWSGVAVAPELQAVVAHATSLFVIAPTSALGTWTYHRAGAVAWRSALPIAAASVVAAFLTSQLAPGIPAPVLKLGFGVLLLVSGARLVRSDDVEPRARGGARWGVAVMAGSAVGIMSALLGVGGGIIAIPILVYFVRLRLQKVAATSMAIIAFTALAAVAGYAVAGAGETGLPTGSVGYVHYLAGLPILAGALLAVSLGARVNQGLDTRKLRILFGALFLLLGVRLVVQNVLAIPGVG